MTEPPATRRSLGIAVACWAVILAVVAAVAVRHQGQDRATAAGAATSSAVGNPAFDLSLAGRTAVSAHAHGALSDTLRGQLQLTLLRAAVRPVDKLALAVVVRELDGAPAAVRQLEADAPAITNAHSPPLSTALEELEAVYGADTPTVLSAAQREDLARELGYFGRLAATQGTGADPADRQAVLAEARRTLIAVTALSVMLFGGLALGLAGFVTLVVLFATGVLRFGYVRPSPGPSDATVWLETFAVWIVGVGGVGLVVGRLPLHLPIFADEAVMASLTAVVAFGWPLWRGRLTARQVRQALGWHTGRGVLTEVVCGLGGYVAGLPVVAAGIGITLVLTKLAHVRPSHPIEREFGDPFSAGHTAGLLLAAAVLAPLLEETMFRGALYAHLRRRHAAWASAGVVALLFAAVHPQGWAAIPALGSIALVLAFLREWRGSLIAPVAAHALNNGVLVAVLSLALG